MKKDKFASIESIIKTAKHGGMYVLVDDENRENEGDLVFCASDVSANKVNFMVFDLEINKIIDDNLFKIPKESEL